MSPRQVFSDSENRVLRRAVERLVDTYGTQTHVAQQLGVSQASVSAFLAGKHGVTQSVARKIAQLSGTTLARLLGWAEGVGPPMDDPYANRHVAIEMARMAGLPESAIRTVQKLRLEKDLIDRPPLWWFDRIRSEVLEPE